MKTLFKFMPVLVVLSILLTSCNLPFPIGAQQAPVLPQPVIIQPTSTPGSPPSAPQNNVPQNDLNNLMVTLSALQTQIAAPPPSAEAPKVIVPADTNTPNPSPTVKPTKKPKPPTKTPEPEISDENGVPVIEITPITPLYYGDWGQYYPAQHYPYYPPQQGTNICNRARFVADISVPDGSRFNQGESFTKTWRLTNDGHCTWTTGYRLVFQSGAHLSGPSHVQMPKTVYPGQSVDLSVGLQAPSADGSYQGFWKLEDESGNTFGIGDYADVAFWVLIRVGSSYYDYNYNDNYNNYNYYNYNDYYNNNNHYNPYYDNYNGYQNPRVSGSCQLVSSTPANGTAYDKNSDIDIRWTIRNTSGQTWHSDQVDYQYISGTKMYKLEKVYDLPKNVSNNGQITIVIDTKMPSSSGTYTTTWGIVEEGTRICTFSKTLRVH